MPSMTYNSLVTQVMDYLDRTDGDTLAQVPNFIYQAEQRICREVETIGLEVAVSGTLTQGVPVLAKPSRWRRSLSFSLGTGTSNNTAHQLYLRSYEYLRLYWPNPTLTDLPLLYSDYGYDHLLFAPTPDQNYPFEYFYLQLPEPLGPTVQTNWLTNNAPDVLLYGTLIEAMTYLKNDERLQVWQGLFDRGVQSLKGQNNERKTDRASDRNSD